MNVTGDCKRFENISKFGPFPFASANVERALSIYNIGKQIVSTVSCMKPLVSDLHYKEIVDITQLLILLLKC